MSATDVIVPERLEALLRGEAPLTRDEARRQALLGDLRGALAVRAPEELRSRVLADAPAPRPRLAAPRPSRRLAVVAVAAALGLAVIAAVVHGVTGSGSGTRRAAPAAVRAHVERTAPPPSFSATTTPQSQHSLSSAAGSVSGVAGGFESAVGGSPTTPTSDSAKAVATPSVGNGGRLQHTDASLVVRVPDVERLSHATSAATQVATALGGYAQSVVYRTPKAGGGESYLELRVPAQNVQRALARLGQLGTIVSQQVSVQDLEHALEQQSAEIAQLERTAAALQQALRDPALPDAQRVLLRIKLAETRRALSQRRHARTGTIAAGTTARVSLVLETKEAVVPVPHHRGRLGRMVHSAVGFLGLEATIALYALIVVGPLLVVAALAWGLSRARRRRDERRLLAA